MRQMCLVEIKRLLKQKFVYFFLLVFCLAAYAYSYLITTNELYDMLNVNPAEASGVNFPEFMSQFYAITIGPIFMAFITALYINEDNMVGMLKQPLLHAKTRIDVLNSKFISLCGLSAFMMIAIYVIVYIIGYSKWGNEVFSMPQFIITFQKFALVTLSLMVMEALTILVSLYSSHTVILVVVMFCIVIVDNLINTNMPFISSYIWFNHSTYYYLITNKGDATLAFKIISVISDIIYFFLFYYLAVRRMKKLEIR